MKVLGTEPNIEYPESDGRPMGEADLHIQWAMRLRDLLRRRYRGQNVYVGGNLLIYYVSGDNQKFVVPDSFVVKNCPPGDRRVFKIWEEGQTPNVVFEVTSKSTRTKDTHINPVTFARLAISELFLYDPSQEYLVPPLQGFRLRSGRYAPIAGDRSGTLACRELNLLVRLDDEGKLVLIDSQTGEPLLTDAEAEQQRAEAERQRAEAEFRVRLEAEARAERAEAELRRLREQLDNPRNQGA